MTAALPQMSAERHPPLVPPRRWWLALLLILLLAGGLRFTGYNFSLPYVDHPDEPNQFLAARLILDTGTARSIGKHSYPPGIVALHYFFVRFWQDPATPPATVTGPVRLVAISASLLTLAVLALTGYHAGAAPAGLLAAAMLAVTPWAVEHSRYATADGFATLFSALALWLTLAGIRYRWPRWTTYALYALMLAVVFKYQALFLMPLVMFAPLMAGRRYRKVVAGNALRLLLFLAWLFLLTPALEPGEDSPIRNWRQVTVFAPDALLRALPGNLDRMLASLDLRLVAPGWAGLALLFTARFGLAGLRPAGLYLLLATLAVYTGVSLFGIQPLRLLLMPFTLMVLLSGMGWMLWLRLLRAWSDGSGLRLARLAPGALALGMAVLALPSLQASLANAQRHTLPDRRNDLADWADGTLASGRFIATEENHKTLNRDWGGYAGETRFDFAGQHALGERSLAEWRAEGVDFAIVPWGDYATLREDDPLGYLAGTTMLKAWPPSAAHRGPAMVVLALRTMQERQPEDANQLGDIVLQGHELDVAGARAGGALRFRLYWRAAAPTAGDYVVFNHLLDAEGALVAQADGPPLPGTRRGTADWDDTQETILSREFVLRLPQGLAAGAYRLVSGWYGRETGERLRAPDGAEQLLLATITLE